MKKSSKSREETRAERERQLQIMRSVATAAELEPSDAASATSRGSHSTGGSSQTSGSRRSARPGGGRQRRRSLADVADDIQRDAGMPIRGQTGRRAGRRGSIGGRRGSIGGGGSEMMPRRRSADVAQAIEDATASGALSTSLDALEADVSGSNPADRDRPARTDVDDALQFLDNLGADVPGSSLADRDRPSSITPKSAVDHAKKFLWDDSLPHIDLDPLSDATGGGSSAAAPSWNRTRNDAGYADQSGLGYGGGFKSRIGSLHVRQAAPEHRGGFGRAEMKKTSSGRSLFGNMGTSVRTFGGSLFGRQGSKNMDEVDFNTNLAPRKVSGDAADIATSMFYDSHAGPLRGQGSRGSSKSGVTPYGPPADTLADRILDGCDFILDGMSDCVDSVYYQFGGCLDYGRRHIWKVVFLLAAVTVIVGASVALTNRKVGAGDSSRGAPAMVSMAGPIADGGRYKSIKSRIIKEGVSSSRDFGNGSTAQSRALYWISEADELQIPPDDPHMAERYTLAVFYFIAADSNLAPGDSGDGERLRRLQDGGNEADVVLHDSDSVQELTGWRQVSNWMSEKGHCSWHGVECHINGAFATHYGTNGITVLNMTNNRIEGMLPKEFGALKDLRVLDLSQNKLKGSIPSALGKAMELVALHLGGNVFTGTIPSEIGQLSKCTHLYLDENELEGSIPSEVTTLSNMQMIGLHVNALTGEIPDFSAMQELRALYLDSNHLSSTIPSTLGALGSSLLDLRLGSNDITGSLPSELGNLSSLRSLHVEENDLSGSLPLEFAGMDVLNELHAYGNKISGSIPIQIGFLGFFSELKVLYLDGNEITGTIPPSVSNLREIVDIYLHHNKLEGTLPDSLSKLPYLRNLRLNDNNLSGTIPADFDSLTRLEYLYLHNNLLEGTIPDELGALTTLFRLRMYGNSLRGTIPRGICHLRDLYLEELEADCDGIRPGIECTCCTACF
mmetsp:Transcript_22703/g.49197  ORF Transcript_22703/g.49197 Transcript_22703/m.49197 type:complete len:958 (-) Transcript_22703:106-2979(-)